MDFSPLFKYFFSRFPYMFLRLMLEIISLLIYFVLFFFKLSRLLIYCLAFATLTFMSTTCVQKVSRHKQDFPRQKWKFNFRAFFFFSKLSFWSLKHTFQGFFIGRGIFCHPLFWYSVKPQRNISTTLSNTWDEFSVWEKRRSPELGVVSMVGSCTILFFAQNCYSVYINPISWSCTIHQLHLCRGVKLPRRLVS